MPAPDADPAQHPEVVGPQNDGSGAAADDPHVLPILTSEFSSLIADRGLVYNEEFARVATFLTVISMSLVALALLAQAMGFTRGFLTVAAVTLGFNLLVGLATIARVLGAIDEDLRMVHGMARIRHGYLEIAPQLRSYFTRPSHDDLSSVMAIYGPAHSGLAGVVYFLSTSLGLMVLLVALTAGVVVLVSAMAVGLGPGSGAWLGAGVAGVTFIGLGVVARRSILAGQTALESLFPATGDARDA